MYHRNDFDHKSLKEWFQEEKRDLPRRDQPNPYAVWISEVMLQQTQVAVVIPYFERWMQRFPTVEKLANASLDEVIKEWEGLGYYSRARNLHAGARMVMENFNGQIPNSYQELQTIKGLGPYTIGAILSFAFRQKATAVDGNVIRVIARYFMIQEDISLPKTVKQIRERVEEALPDKTPWIFNEALIELGATICKKKPQCHTCPIKQSCQSFQRGIAEDLPIKLKKTPIIPLFRMVSIIRWNERYLVKRGEEGAIMHDLHEFPYFESESSGWSVEQMKEQISNTFELDVDYIGTLPSVKHTFTKYRVQLMPMTLETKERREVTGYQWMTIEELNQLAFSSGHRKIFVALQKA